MDSHIIFCRFPRLEFAMYICVSAHTQRQLYRTHCTTKFTFQTKCVVRISIAILCNRGILCVMRKGVNHHYQFLTQIIFVTQLQTHACSSSTFIPLSKPFFQAKMRNISNRYCVIRWKTSNNFNVILLPKQSLSIYSNL